MAPTQPVHIDIFLWVKDIKDIAYKSALSNSDSTNMRILSDLTEMNKIISRSAEPDHLDICFKKLASVVSTLQRSYEAAVQNQWAEYDSYHRIAILEVAELLKSNH